MELKTTDLYLTAYLLNQQIKPKKITTEGNRRKKIIFSYNNNPETLKHIENFNSGKATANVISFRHDYEIVRDWMFASLRDSG